MLRCISNKNEGKFKYMSSKGLNKKKVSLRRVVVLSVFFSATVIVLITTSILLSRFNQTITNSALVTTQQAANNISNSVSTFLDSNLKTLDYVKSEILKVDYVDIKDTGKSIFELRPDIVCALVYDENANIVDYYSHSHLELKENYQENNQSYFCDEDFIYYHISPPHVNNLFSRYYPWVITLTSKIQKDDIPYYIALDFEFSGIANYIDAISIGERGYAYVADKDGPIIYHPQQQLIYSKLKVENIVAMKESTYFGAVATDNYIYASSYLGISDWYIIGVSYIDELVNVNRDEFLNAILLVLLVGILLILILAFFMAKKFTTPVNKLILAMADFEKNVESYQGQEVNGFYEIETLNKSFDHMAKRIKKLMEKIVAEEQEIRKVELKALQNQINPHFLYNTLDSILWMCQKNGNTEAADMVSALAKLFRISISKGKDLITIDEELTHVTNYLIIQKIRYKNHFEYVIDVDEEILSYKCLNIILQPFVENAIYHGIDRMVDEGQITITGKKCDTWIELKVRDNGLGMTKEEVDTLFEPGNEKAGVGVKNVHSRIQIYFGKAYGIEVKSELDVGTEILLRIPLLEDKDEN